MNYLSNTAPIAKPSGRVVGRSFKECTTKSTVSFLKASSKSLVNNDFSPIFGKDTFSILSPNVVMVTAVKKGLYRNKDYFMILIKTNNTYVILWLKSEIKSPQLSVGWDVG